ncbi:MAG: N-acyl homoserine lactonase family protein [Clostridia bacterium]|jgi:glyoxylase-like metal-dependent hydrolase (beta-lactamase superfamily II)|nr:N-acyl homoserine lactonase family protein [Clostridia bacterium]
MSKFTLYPLHLGVITRRKSEMAYNLDPEIFLDLPVIAWYLTDGKQKILVDTGGSAPDGVRFMPYTQSEDQKIDKQLLKIGVKPEEIESVILTHLHWDHASNNQLFPNAKFYVQKAELQYAVAPIPLHIKSYDLPLIFQTKYEVLEGDTQFTDGIELILTPGHSPGSQTVLVDTEKGIYALTGDLLNLIECWNRTPKVANGWHTDLVDCYKSFDKVAKRADFILPGHEPGILDHPQYPY